MVDFEDQHSGEIPENGLIFMNRLSDYFFTLARFVNNLKNTKEIPWISTKE
jgi:cob(I)alamin adenosyltransferase